MCKNMISFYLTVCFVCLLYVNYIHQLPLSTFRVSGKECRTTSKPCSPAVPPDVFCLVSVGHVRSGLPDQESLQRRTTCWRPGRTCLWVRVSCAFTHLHSGSWRSLQECFFSYFLFSSIPHPFLLVLPPGLDAASPFSSPWPSNYSTYL